MTAIAFNSVAMPTEQLQVINMIRATDRRADDMVDFQVLDLEMFTAAVALASLFAIEQGFVFRCVIAWHVSQKRMASVLLAFPF